MSPYDSTPAAVARRSLGERETAPDPGEFTAAERGELAAEFRRAWGWEDPAGRLTKRGEERQAQWYHAQRAGVGLDWIVLDEEGTRELARRMKASAEAAIVAGRMETDAASMMAETWRRLNAPG